MDSKRPAAWVSISQYARLYGLTRNTVYKLIEQQRLESYRVLRIVRVKNVSPDQHLAKAPSSTI